MIGDFLHLVAVLMLVLKILANKNVIGMRINNDRTLIQNTITLLGSIFVPLHRHIYWLENAVLVSHESNFHWVDCVYYVPHEDEETIQLELQW